jgi:hypothetical protein
MFTQLRFQNFKSWRDTGTMRMAPLTGFFGDEMGDLVAMTEAAMQRQMQEQ